MQVSNFIEQYSGKATYQIVVKGKVDPKFIRKLSELDVSHAETNGQTLSTLTGQIEDQEALSGIISVLINNQYTIYSVMKIDM